MARRHEDRKSGERFQRGGPRGGRKPHPGPRPTGARRPSVRRERGLVVKPAAAPEVAADGKVRLNRYLAMSGVCSRRAADEVIAGGRVEINGKTVTELGCRVDPKTDDVRVDGDRVRTEKLVYVLLNKPKGVVCTNARHEQKTRVIDLLPEVRGRLFTVGRLDMDSEGLILLTNDGQFALRMTHPRFGVPKTYAVLIRGRVEQESLRKARGGVWLAEGPTTGMEVRVERTWKDRTYLKVVLREGKNREIRRVFAKLGYNVISLKRQRIGELTLHGLKEGGWRFVQAHEIKQLLEIGRRELEMPQ
ncbi:MAG: rRNA pseudouridine synthase [Planctomycetes bacterium]|nr:rRNA pseudouridine synthase [Planctomycetota bacterium]